MVEEPPAEAHHRQQALVPGVGEGEHGLGAVGVDHLAQPRGDLGERLEQAALARTVEIVEAALEKEQVEFVQEVAYQLPMHMIADVLGTRQREGKSMIESIVLALERRVDAFPLEIGGGEAAAAADVADGFAVDQFRPGIDARRGNVAQAIAHDLHQVQHKFVVVVQLVNFDTHDAAVVGDAEQEVATGLRGQLNRQVRRIREVAVMQYEIGVIDVPVLIDVVDSPGVKRARAANYTMDFVFLF